MAINETRPPRPDELAAVKELLDVSQDILDQGLKAVVLDAGPESGVAAYLFPDDKTAATQLGAIVLPDTAADLKDMYRLILGVAKAGLAAGCTLGESHGVTDAALVRALSRTFNVRVVEEGHEPRTEEQVKAGAPAVPKVWGFYVDLEDVASQLEKALA